MELATVIDNYGGAAEPGEAGSPYVLVLRADLDELLSFVRSVAPLMDQWAAFGERLAAGGPAALFGLLRPGP